MNVPIIVIVFLVAMLPGSFFCGYSTGYEAQWISDEKLANRYNGWLTKRVKHFVCGMIHGHDWEDDTPLLDQGVKFQTCKRCGKERMV